MSAQGCEFNRSTQHTTILSNSKECCIMPRKPRIHYTETDKALMWDRWRKADIANHGIQRHDLSEQVIE